MLVRAGHQKFERVDETVHTLSGLLAEWADSTVERVLPELNAYAAHFVVLERAKARSRV